MKATERELLSMFDCILDEENPDVVINGMSYLPSRVLKDTDEIAYREEFLQFLTRHNFQIEE